MGKQMEGDNRQRRQVAREARREGKSASEAGATLGASKQRARSDDSMSHQEQIDTMRQGKHEMISQNTPDPEARPGSRDSDTPDSDRHPKLKNLD